MIGTEGCMALCDLLSGGCGNGMAGGAEMPIEPDTPSGELEPGVRPELNDPASPDMVGDTPGIGDIPGIVDCIPDVIDRVAPEEGAAGVAAGYVGSEALGDAYPLVLLCGCC
jgi:hypothetical protein